MAKKLLTWLQKHRRRLRRQRRVRKEGVMLLRRMTHHLAEDDQSLFCDCDDGRVLPQWPIVWRAGDGPHFFAELALRVNHPVLFVERNSGPIVFPEVDTWACTCGFC